MALFFDSIWLKQSFDKVWPDSRNKTLFLLSQHVLKGMSTLMEQGLHLSAMSNTTTSSSRNHLQLEGQYH